MADGVGRSGGGVDKPVSEYLLIKTDVLPEVFTNVMQVKSLLQSGQVDSVNEAVKQVGMSRSAFYKYRDSVQAWQDPISVESVTIVASLLLESDALSGLILNLTNLGAKLLNISQSLPRRGFVDLMLTADLSEMDGDRVALKRLLAKVPGVRRLEIWSAEDDNN